MCPMPSSRGAQACWPWHVGGLPGAQPLLAVLLLLAVRRACPSAAVILVRIPPSLFTPNPVPDPALSVPKEGLRCFSHSWRTLCWGQQDVSGAGPRCEGSAVVFESRLPLEHTTSLASHSTGGDRCLGRSDSGG